MDQDIRKFLKRLNIQESTVSTVLGILVVLITLGLIFNYWRSTRNTTSEQTSTPTPTLAPGEVKLVERDGQLVPQGLPTKHAVEAGEHLWGISQKYYGSGYNWIDIASDNKLTAPYALERGQELNIPQVPVRNPQATEASPAPQASPAATASPTTVSPTLVASPTAQPTGVTGATGTVGTPSGEKGADAISGDKYTVVRGDSLWKIAVRAYGDGYQWVKISQANNLRNPNLILPGQELALPR